MQVQARRAALIAAALFAIPAAASAQATQDTTQLPAPMREARASLQKAFTQLSAGPAAAHFAEDVYVRFGGAEYRGHAAASAWLAEALSGLNGLRFADARFAIGADEVVETGSWSVGLPDGTVTGGTIETVWRRGPERWVVARLLVE